jgi:hypothetical protein
LTLLHRPKLAHLEIPFESVDLSDDIRGDLSETPLVPLLEQLAADGRTGVLRIDGGGEIWLDAGLVYLTATAESADVASVLFGGGVAPLPEIEQLLAADGASVADDLSTRQPEAAPVIGRLLHEHNLTGLFELMVPKAGTFHFDDAARHAVGPKFAESLGDLVIQAERRLDIWRQIAARIPTVEVSFKLSRTLPESGEERLVTADEWRYLSLLDSHRSVADVVNETGESAFRVCTSLYRLLLEGLIEEV